MRIAFFNLGIHTTDPPTGHYSTLYPCCRQLPLKLFRRLLLLLFDQTFSSYFESHPRDYE